MELDFAKVETTETIAVLAEMAAEIWREYFICVISAAQIEYMLDKFQSIPALTDQIHQRGYEYYFLNMNGMKIGYIGFKQEEDRLFLSKFYIEKECRGKGYASQAIHRLVQICKERNLDAIWLTVNRHNSASIAVYEKKGFRIVRSQVKDIGNGYVMDDYVMEKAIPVMMNGGAV